MQTIVVAGSGFAGFWAVIAAMRVISHANKEEHIRVVLISPSPNLTILPRLYEAALDNLSPDISAQIAAVGVEYLAGKVKDIHSESRTLTVDLVDGGRTTLIF